MPERCVFHHFAEERPTIVLESIHFIDENRYDRGTGWGRDGRTDHQFAVEGTS